jgi:HlyD family secretion protein
MKKKGLVLAAIVLVAAAVTILVNSFGKTREDGTLLLSGNVEVTEAGIAFKIPGRVIERTVDEGYRVKKGDILAKLDDEELSGLVKQQRAALEEALTRLAELKAGSRPQEVEQAKSGVALQEADLARTRKDFERAEVLYRNGAVSAASFDASKSAYETRLAQLKTASEQLSLVREGPRKETITAAQHRVEQAMAALRVAEAKLADSVIVAPTDGIVLRKNVEIGETVAQGTPVVTLGDLAHPWIKVYVREEKLGLVKLGQKAKVTTDTYRGKVYEGTVTYISSEAEFTPKTVQTQEERVKLVFAIKVSVTNEKDELKPSMPADVRIMVGK